MEKMSETQRVVVVGLWVLVFIGVFGLLMHAVGASQWPGSSGPASESCPLDDCTGTNYLPLPEDYCSPARLTSEREMTCTLLNQRNECDRKVERLERENAHLRSQLTIMETARRAADDANAKLLTIIDQQEVPR